MARGVYKVPPLARGEVDPIDVHLREGGRDPRKDPWPGDVVGYARAHGYKKLRVIEVPAPEIVFTIAERDDGCLRTGGEYRRPLEEWVAGTADMLVYGIATERVDRSEGLAT